MHIRQNIFQIQHNAKWLITVVGMPGAFTEFAARSVPLSGGTVVVFNSVPLWLRRL